MEAIIQTTLFRLFITFVLVPGLLAGCIVIDLHGSGFKTVKGSGEVISETRQVTDFDSIKLEGPGKVMVTRGKIQSLVIRADDNIIPHIETSVRNKKLIISNANINLRPTTLNIIVTLSDLKGTSIAGSGEVISQN